MAATRLDMGRVPGGITDHSEKRCEALCRYIVHAVASVYEHSNDPLFFLDVKVRVPPATFVHLLASEAWKRVPWFHFRTTFVVWRDEKDGTNAATIVVREAEASDGHGHTVTMQIEDIWCLSVTL